MYDLLNDILGVLRRLNNKYTKYRISYIAYIKKHDFNTCFNVIAVTACRK